LSIPDFGSASTGMESLNVAVATAIVCAEFRRQNAFSSV
ncbi:MAG: RNA methyltransferase, partial [Bacteroidota bacterium]